MAVDEAQKNFQTLLNELGRNLDQEMNEATTRLRIINRILTETLGWHHDEIIAEPYSQSGFADYLFTVQGYNPFVVEAKRAGAELIDASSDKLANYKLGGSALKSAQEGIKQALGYCMDKGAPFAAVTTGTAWIGFMANGSGKPPSERKTFVFPSFNAIMNDFAIFYDLFSREGILTKKYLTLFNRIEGLSIVHAGELNFVITNN